MWVEKHGPTYRIRDLVGDKKVTVQSGLPNKTVAKKLMVTLQTDKVRGENLVHGGGKVTLGEWIETWWPSYEITLKGSARVSSVGIRDRYILPMLGAHRLDDLDRLVIQRWVADLRAGRQPIRQNKTHKTRTVGRPLARKTVANAHGLLHKIVGEAVAQRLIRSNPCEGTKLGQKQHHEMVFLTEQEAARLVGAMREHYRPLVLTLLGTGMRWGEVVGLRVKDVDVLDRRISVRKNLQELADTAQLVEEEPKSAASRRPVRITARLAGVLAGMVVGKNPLDRVFLAERGGSVRYRTFWRLFNQAREEAGIPECRIHDLRHTHAAWLISSRIRGGLTAIQRRLGHSSIRVTSDLYGHLMPEVDDDITAALDERLPEGLHDLDGGDGGTVGESRGTLENSGEPARTLNT